MPTLTKAALESQLEAAQARIAELEAAVQPQPATEQRDQLQQVIWLQREAPDPDERSFTQEGEPMIRFSGQFARLDKKSGRRYYGPDKYFVAYGSLARRIAEIFSGDTRLVRINAYERPFAPDQQGRRRCDWVVVDVQAMPRLAPAAAPAQLEPPIEEPCQEEVPF